MFLNVYNESRFQFISQFISRETSSNAIHILFSYIFWIRIRIFQYTNCFLDLLLMGDNSLK